MGKITDLALQGIIDDPTGVNSHTVLAIATELQAFRAADGATPPDFQVVTGFYYTLAENVAAIRGAKRDLFDLGASTFRVTKHDDENGVECNFVDGWKGHPAKQAPFRVLPPIDRPDITGTDGEAW